MAIAYLSLGSNQGDRIGYVQQAAGLIGAEEKISIVRTSAFYETEPWNMSTKNWFVNAVIEIKTQYSPYELLEICKKTEQKLGREPHNSQNYEDRTIDIDILFYDKEIINDENLTIPHKFVHLRAFTLVPMLELNPEFTHPVLHKNIIEMHNDLENPEMVFLYGTRVDF